MKSGLREAIVRQFKRPTGLVGRLVGLVMATRPSNRERSRRTIDLLRIQPEDWVLEIGYGPGLAIQWAAERAVRGKVVGVDHSEVMRRQAERRNCRAIQVGSVEVYTAALDTLPAFDGSFDKVFAVNVYMFWHNPVDALAKLAAVMKPGATIALTVQPRYPRATNEDTRRGAEQIKDSVRAAGLSDVRAEILPMKPVDAACVLGTWPGARQKSVPHLFSR